jgi:hypothetical protein
VITPQIRHLANEAKRNQTHCKRGHPLSGENLYYTSHGSRGCRTCNRLRKANRLQQQDQIQATKRQELIDQIRGRMAELDVNIKCLSARTQIHRDEIGRWLQGIGKLTQQELNAVLDALAYVNGTQP